MDQPFPHAALLSEQERGFTIVNHNPLFTKDSNYDEKHGGKRHTGNKKVSLLAFPAQRKAGGMKNLHILFTLAFHPQWLGSALKNHQSF